MAYTPFTINNFSKGLNLRDKADVLGSDEAVDLLNVVFTERGAVAQRSGYTQLTGTALTNTVDSLWPFYTSTGTKQLLAGCGTRLEAINTSGAVVSSATGLSGGPWTFTRFAAPGSETAYAGNGTDTLRKWDGTNWTAPTATVDGTAGRAMPKAGCVAVFPVENRLAATGFATSTGGPHGVASNPSRVFFSNAGLPETWETDGLSSRGANYIDITPGDGESIMGMIAWGTLLFVFKETKFAVFYGTTGSGTSLIFNYKMVDAGVGLASRRALTAGHDGVYFMSRSGVYRTTGYRNLTAADETHSEPKLVSAKLDPFFVGGASLYFRSNTLNHAQITKAAMGFHENFLYLSVPTGTSTTNDTMLVYDPRYNWWSLWNIPASALTSFRISNQAELVFGYPAGAKEIGRHSSAYTSDDGTAITSRWRSGWNDLGASINKTVREVKLWGTGTCSVSLTSDFASSPLTSTTAVFGASADTWGDGTDPTHTWGDGSATDLWGPAAQVYLALVRQAERGTTFSLQLSNSTLNITWSLSRVTLHVREKRFPSLLTTDR